MLCTLKNSTFEAVKVPDISGGTWTGDKPDWIDAAFADGTLKHLSTEHGICLIVGLSNNIPGRPWSATCGAARPGVYLVRNPDGTINIVDADRLHRHCDII